MRKEFYKLLILSVMAGMVSGCGGTGQGGDGAASASKEPARTVAYTGDIALWDYLVPASDTSNNYIRTSGSETKKYQRHFTRSSDGVTEKSDLAPNEKTVYTNNGNTIKITFYTDNVQNGVVELKSKVNVNDIVTVKRSDCTLTRKLATFNYSGHTYNDVIEIVCGETPGYYQRGVGEIVQQTTLTPSGTVETKILDNGK